MLVRREQIDEVLPDLRAACGIERIVLMVSHANGSDGLFAVLGRKRVVLGFPSAAGSIENGIDIYVDVAEQRTIIEQTAPDIAVLLRTAGFRVQLVSDVDSWLKRHTVFVTAVGGALYQKKGDSGLLSSDKKLVRTFIFAVREGWSALDGRGVGPPPLALRAIFCWVPLPVAVLYWCYFFRSARGEYYFARHTRHHLGRWRRWWRTYTCSFSTTKRLTYRFCTRRLIASASNSSFNTVSARGSTCGALQQQYGDIVFVEVWIYQCFETRHRGRRSVSQSSTQRALAIIPGD